MTIVFEEWTYDVERSEVCAPRGITLAQNVRPTDGRLMAASPDMVRALLGVLEREPGSDLRVALGAERLEDIRAALRKAGVID